VSCLKLGLGFIIGFVGGVATALTLLVMIGQWLGS
jgi:hypothetical protein